MLWFEIPKKIYFDRKEYIYFKCFEKELGILFKEIILKRLYYWFSIYLKSLIYDLKNFCKFILNCEMKIIEMIDMIINEILKQKYMFVKEIDFWIWFYINMKLWKIL